MTDYPRDVMALYAQGHSVVRFLVSLPQKDLPIIFRDPALGAGTELKWPDSLEEKQQLAVRLVFLHYLRIGMDGNREATWNEAAKRWYGFTSVDALEAAWLEWLRKPESQLKAKARPPEPTRTPTDEKPDLIPPIVLPRSAPPAPPLSESLTIPPPNIPPTGKQ
jgi:hypothetical protein